jgi:hypothetical protein
MMGLMDFLFGSEPEMRVLDPRLKREPQGELWWQTFDRTWGSGGPMNPLVAYDKIGAGLDQMMGWKLAPVGKDAYGTPVMKLVSSTMQNAPIAVSGGGITRQITPRWARNLPLQYSSAMSGLMQPWFNAGMSLESSRMGQPYRTSGSSGLFGGLMGAATNLLGRGLGGAAIGSLFDLGNTPSLMSAFANQAKPGGAKLPGYKLGALMGIYGQ